MISGLSKYTAKINPMLLNTLQKLYIARAKVHSSRDLQEQNINVVFDQINIYQDGKGYEILKKFDDLFQLNKNIPVKQYELLNTSYVDAFYITSILEVSILDKLK